MMKKCFECGIEKELSDFNKNIKRKDGTQTYCRGCQRIKDKKFYKENKDRTYLIKRKQKKILRDKRKKLIIEAKDKPCKDCGIKYPYYVMDFDHLRDKVFTIGARQFQMSEEDLLKEIDKCDVICSNCHRIRTFKRSGYTPL